MRTSASAIIHFVDPNGAGVSPLCHDTKHARRWTTVPTLASCPDCVALLAYRRVAEKAAAHHAAHRARRKGAH